MTIFHKSEQVRGDEDGTDKLPTVPESALKALYTMHEAVQQKERGAWLMFDIDGVLIKAGLETPAAPESLESYIVENQGMVDEFKKRIENLKKLGFKIAINTGRGREFTERVVSQLFPNSQIDNIICESGAVIGSLETRGRDKGEYVEAEQYYAFANPQGVDTEKVRILKEHRQEIIAFAQTLGGDQEHGSKEVILSLNPPQGTDMEQFYRVIKNWIEERIAPGVLDITHSKTAVDIAPKGIDKLAALKEVVGSDIVAYFGDAPGDERAMSGSEINITPGNAFMSTKEVSERATFGLNMDRNELAGVGDALHTIELYSRFARRSANGRAT